MIFLILSLFAFGTLNIIHHLTIIEQLKAVKRNQLDILDLLEEHDLYVNTLEDELNGIRQSINNIAYANRHE